MEASTSAIDISGRFASTTHEQLENFITNATPKNTINKSKWAMNTFKTWLADWRLRINDNIPKVLKEVEEFTTEELDYCLRYFWCDARKENKQRYPPQTLKDLCTGIQYFFNNTFDRNISIFKDKEFKSSRKSLDSQMKQAANEGLVKPKRKAVVICNEKENELWSNGTFGSALPKQLLLTLIYYFGMHFSLRAAQEHRDLEYGENSQIQLKVDEDGIEYLEYVERVSKNKRFGIKQARMEPKNTRLYSRKDKSRCPVECYKRYISHRPEMNNGRPCSAFYLGVIQNPKDSKWYKPVPFGVHSIQNATRDLFKFSNIDGFISNSSLRRTAQNRLLQGGVPDSVIKKKTGRISESADLAYVEPKLYEKEMSAALYGESIGGSDTEPICSYSRKDVSISSSKDVPIPVTFTNCNNCSVTINYNFQH